MPQASRRSGLSAVPLYETDFHRWAREQVLALRGGGASDIDWENVAEEIESLGRRDRHALENRLEILLTHLLKCIVQSEKRTASWDVTIQEQRRAIMKLIERNPSLKGVPERHYAEAYRQAVWRAYRDTGIEQEAFPKTNPFSLENTLDLNFMPN